MKRFMTKMCHLWISLSAGKYQQECSQKTAGGKAILAKEHISNWACPKCSTKISFLLGKSTLASRPQLLVKYVLHTLILQNSSRLEISFYQLYHTWTWSTLLHPLLHYVLKLMSRMRGCLFVRVCVWQCLWEMQTLNRLMWSKYNHC